MSTPEYFDQPLSEAALRRLIDEGFGDMLKFVVDLDREVIAAGGEFHSDEEAILLEKGSSQSHLWGANFYPARPEGKKLVYTSMINVRSRDGNPKQEIQSLEIRQKIAAIAHKYFGAI